MKAGIVISLAGILTLAMLGCTLPSRAPMVSRGQVGVAAILRQGTVVATSPVTIAGNRSHIGLASGAGIAGPVAAGGRYDTTGILVGAVGAAAGAVVGQTVEEAVTRKPAQRITIRMDNGSTIEVVQEAEEGFFQEGDRVDVAVGQGNTRVSMSMGIDRAVDSAIPEPAWYELDDSGSP